jgi:hypothetical protein
VKPRCRGAKMPAMNSGPAFTRCEARISKGSR